MENCVGTTQTEVWTEVFASTGLCGVLALCSGTLSAKETNTIKYINNFAVTNSYVRKWMVNKTVEILRNALTRTSGATD